MDWPKNLRVWPSPPDAMRCGNPGREAACQRQLLPNTSGTWVGPPTRGAGTCPRGLSRGDWGRLSGAPRGRSVYGSESLGGPDSARARPGSTAMVGQLPAALQSRDPGSRRPRNLRQQEWDRGSGSLCPLNVGLGAKGTSLLTQPPCQPPSPQARVRSRVPAAGGGHGRPWRGLCTSPHNAGHLDLLTEPWWDPRAGDSQTGLPKLGVSSGKPPQASFSPSDSGASEDQALCRRQGAVQRGLWPAGVAPWWSVNP